MTALWWWLVAAAAAAWALKLLGLSVPAAWLERPTTERLLRLLPVAMLAGLAAVALVDGGGTWRFDPALVVGTAAAVALVVAERVGVLGAFVVGAGITALARLVLG